MSLQLGRNVFGNPAHQNNVLAREEAIQLLQTWVLNPKLQLHMLQVAHLMKCWAAEKEQLSELEVWKWEMAGLLHDADWDQWPELHCKKLLKNWNNAI
ncbi:hypothetical protein [Hydrotalea sp.]|uniref:hypothetical protein n=1 Tax=Hydrotalea sp. TaxID=2881279 RepID=UPI002628E76A|nr:hypothetical protein [Hydrotalea sp.]